MKKILLITVLLFVANIYAQSGAHTTASKVNRAFLSKDDAQLLTLSGTELVLWDNSTDKPIWTKKLADLGFGNEILYNSIVGIHPYLKYIIINNYTSFKCLVNLTTFKVIRWNYDDYDFLADGRIAVVEYDFSKPNRNKVNLYNLDTGEKELIAEKMSKISIHDNGKLINILEEGKRGLEYDKSKWYSLASKSFIKKPADLNLVSKNQKSGNYFISYDYENKTIKTTDASGKEIASFGIQNPLVGAMQKNQTYMFSLSEIKPHVYFLEQNNQKPFENLSYVYVYDFTNGKVLKKIELHDTSDKSIQLANAELEKQGEINAEKQRIFNLPENVLKRRLFNLYGRYVYNNNTKGIYYIVPDMPLYEGDLVKMKTLHDDKKQEMEVYEKLTVLENSPIYKTINGKKTCYMCGGKGYFQSSHQRTVADYEYTTGKKLVETTTKTSGCSNCGGCGLTPN